MVEDITKYYLSSLKMMGLFVGFFFLSHLFFIFCIISLDYFYDPIQFSSVA